MSNLGLDPSAGLKLLTQEIYGDWYRDPWGWPEFKWIQANVQSFVIEDYYDVRARRLKCAPVFHCMDVPKSHLGIRPAVIQDPLSRFLYITATAASMKSLHSNLPEFVFGWRSPRAGLQKESIKEGVDKSEGNDGEWDKYIDHVRLGSDEVFGMQADITSFFASIDNNRLLTEVSHKLGKTASVAIMGHVIEAHNLISRRSGLPQRSFGSAALANFYMSPIDDALAAAVRNLKAVRVARWMDDIVAFGDESALYGLYLDLQEQSRMIGLELNTAKGRLGPAADIVKAIDLEQIRDVKIAWKELQSDYEGDLDLEGSDVDEADVEKLIELEEVALNEGPQASRTWLRAALKSLTKSENFDREEDWRKNARNIPHAADSLGRYLRGSAEEGYFFRPGGSDIFNFHTVESWPDLSDWLVDYLASDWCKIDWVKAQLALSVPSKKVTPQLRAVLQAWFEQSLNLQLVAVAGQRISELDPDVACEIVRQRADTIHDPLLERVFALCLLQTGKDRSLVESIVRRSPSNVLLYEWMKSNNWKPAKVVHDFDRD